jgi:hypothetical protein
MKRGHACGRCGGPRRNRSQVALVGECSLCFVALCQKHAMWEAIEDRTVCSKCARKNSLTVIKAMG